MHPLVFAALVVVAFSAMELVSYATHRWLMHGPGMPWHVSHHTPPTGRVEKNDLFPLVFSVVGVALFVAAAAGATFLWPIAAGVTLYGLAYLLVHEVAIHRRVGCPVPTGRYVRWLQRAHAGHHRDGGEPYGMLLPLGARRPEGRSAADESELLVRRVAIRRTRSRL